MEPLKPQVITDFLPGITSIPPIAPIRFPWNPCGLQLLPLFYPKSKMVQWVCLSVFLSFVDFFLHDFPPKNSCPNLISTAKILFQVLSYILECLFFAYPNPTHCLGNSSHSFSSTKSSFPKYPNLYYSLLTQRSILSVT